MHDGKCVCINTAGRSRLKPGRMQHAQLEHALRRLLQVDPAHEQTVIDAYRGSGLSVATVGSVAESSNITVSVGSAEQITGAAMFASPTGTTQELGSCCFKVASLPHVLSIA